MNPATAQARVIVDELIRHGLRIAVLCPGSRNAPFSLALFEAAQQGSLELHVRIDERGAGFLALGAAKAAGLPVAVFCTSGTAAANLHPAVAEADRSGVGLLVLTSDRPPELRASGANQVIDQHRLFGSALRWFDEVAVAENRPGQQAYWRSRVSRAWQAAEGMAAGAGPVQLNIGLREPLLPDGETDWCESLDGRPDGGGWLSREPAAAGRPLRPDTARGLVLLAEPDASVDIDRIAAWAHRNGWPLLAETGGVGPIGAAGLTGGMHLLADRDFLAAHRPEQVLCVGRPTVFRQVQALLADPAIEVLLIGAPDSTTPANNVRAVGTAVQDCAAPADPEWLAAWQAADHAVTGAVAEVLAQQAGPTGLAVAAEVIDGLPPETLLVVGSSNPTRDIALSARTRPDVRVLRNRGAAGIDGTVSTAVGAALAVSNAVASPGDGEAASTRPGYALLGDLTFLHDLNGLLIGPPERRPDLTIVVCNDDGGGIFELLEQGAPEHRDSFERVFGTPHGAALESLCAGYGVEYTLAASGAELRQALLPRPGLRVVEVWTERADLRAVHARLRDRVRTALRELT
ncbi:2-succinyl-5-enolpyruvyl-6-hydroxy-3-cyclohexene-1-carboxylic-acid synthase [Actinoalloteichus hymeniacidonis]|uniref:2-succinyl-5-enolpyruvyl-6-hydroxy-3-cyclohexene-1-carboxylate synthase n=1 Tax=Actinoalloteichus hymeniacidonis TaxID=340345 RepID=A0AAC9HLI7_9PSEU|nr:2-succinyl-5-enolpyruvyl-6-hydroxy-3-cyclohexene-1-carboxylic-acid synthase [Actinoalloteichus hymeniacidonis]AOS61344.1 2-succinyl-5-enolpyruvyl-6-hydroxy-3-cyclohexene-1-carboxylic-acid synthase [Actinoalloteichus hymeniacidonis]MBB5910651.1 2-succinyl-5-enolpyruvyl-6-hydroxy-3-cyclohexene-1-carboxylate synthase [Actinoalloteichus hymeniacidonis]